MTTQHKTPMRRSSAKDREFEQLLRRAALYAKTQTARDVRVAPRKRVRVAAA